MTRFRPLLRRLPRQLLAGIGCLAVSALCLWLLIVVMFLLIGWVDVGATIQSWIHSEPEGLGFEVALDEPEGGCLTVTNVGGSPARALRMRIVEDYTYADAGTYEYAIWVGDLAPGEHRVVAYATGQPFTEADIGALKVWLISDRGTAFDYGAWSYAF
jgi:hypothetical protein